MSYNPYPCKTDIEQILNIYELFVYVEMHYVTNSACKNVLKIEKT
jgi:hypothetical protein